MSVFPPFVLHACLLSVINHVYICPYLPISLSVLLFCFLESPVLFCHHMSPFPIFCFQSVFLFLVVLCFAFVFVLCILYFIDFCISLFFFFFFSKLACCSATCLLVCLSFGSSIYWTIQSDFKRPTIPLERQNCFASPVPLQNKILGIRDMKGKMRRQKTELSFYSLTALRMSYEERT